MSGARFYSSEPCTARDNPNADAMRYFCGAIWPLCAQQPVLELVIAGYESDDALSDLKVDGVRVVGTAARI